MKKLILMMMTLGLLTSCDEAQQFELLKASHSNTGIYNNNSIEAKQVILNIGAHNIMASLAQNGRLDFFMNIGTGYESIRTLEPNHEVNLRDSLGDDVVDATQVLNIFSNGKSLVVLKRDNSIVTGGERLGGGEAPILGPFQQSIISIDVVGTSYEIVFADGKKFKWGEDFLPLNTNYQPSFRTIVGKSMSNNVAHSILGFFDKDMSSDLSDLRDVFFELKPNGALDFRVWEPDDFYYYNLDSSAIPSHLRSGGVRDINFINNSIVSVHFDGSIISHGTANLPSEFAIRGNEVYSLQASQATGSFALIFRNGEFVVFGECDSVTSNSYPGLRVVSMSPSPQGFVTVFHNNDVATLASTCLSEP